MLPSASAEFLQVIYWSSLIAVVVSASSAVIKAGFKQFDLFGVIMIAIATGLGGGSVRDMLLDRPVFWIADQVFFVATLAAAVAMFVVARLVRLPPQLFLVPDAAGLATFGVSGTLAALMFGSPWLVASFMGVMTGILGGVMRDILCNEPPVVFQSPLYATVAWSGSLLFVGFLELGMPVAQGALIAGLLIFVGRLLAIRFNLTLPRFRFRE